MRVRRRTVLAAWLGVLGWIAVAGLAHAFSNTRGEEIVECRADEIVTWGDGRDRRAIAARLRFAYDHSGAPAWFSREEVAAMVARAAREWAKCGIPTEVVALPRLILPGENLIVVRWGEEASRGNFGLANLGTRSLGLGPGPFALLRERNPRHDARETLQMVLSHEMGHFYGLMAHSRRCVDVLSYYHNGKGEKCFSRDPAGMAGIVEYRHSLPTSCDIARCRATNDLPPLPGGRLGP